jgi:MOSC domain-containing protein YiiM
MARNGAREDGRLEVVSVNVGPPRDVEWRGKPVRTGIFKQSVAGPVRVRRLNLDGDGQADLSVHGGVDKAVYVYPSEHYPFWREELSLDELPWGAFGENLTSVGLAEAQVWIGDRFRVGSAELVCTQPRIPCFKLGIRFGRPDVVKRFQRSGRSGFYCAVAAEGSVQAGDAWQRLGRDDGSMSIAELLRAYYDEEPALLERAARLPALSASWREHFETRLSKARP